MAAKKGKKKTTPKKRASAKKTSVKQSRQTNPMQREIIFLAVLVFGVLSIMSVFHMCGVFGEYLNTLLFGMLGGLAYVFPVYLIGAAGIFISNDKNRKIRQKVLFSAGIFWFLCGAFQWVVDDPVKHFWELYSVCAQNQGGGGVLGGILSVPLTVFLGRAGAIIVILAGILLFFMLITGKHFFASIYQLYSERDKDSYVEYEEDEDFSENFDRSPTKRKMNTFTFDREKKKPAKEPVVQDEIKIIGTPQMDENETPIYREEMENKFGRQQEALQEKPKDKTKSKKSEKKSEKVKITKEDEKELEKVQKQLDEAASMQISYKFPPLSLLSRPTRSKKGMTPDELRGTAGKLQETLESFGVHVKLGDISLGPSVTRYELIPEQGVKVSKITSLSDDIKLSLAASDIRIEAPIPGKAAVGIEVPNPERASVSLRELLESTEFEKAKSKVTFAVGKDISGKTIVTDIAKMPHLLIAGATGSGKSVLINTLIMSILYKASPNEVKLIMVDPKMVELTAYEDIPHLMIPVVKDPKKASAALAWAVAEMTDRYQKFAEAGVRDIQSYNARIDQAEKSDDPEYQKMPQIVIIVDEFADLMMVAPGEVEDAVCRLAQLARAAGIHLVLATQRPSVNVITGLIKANIPSRIALSVSSQIDSRTILDSAGAEKLLGNGDMLFAPQNLPKPIRVQGAFVSDEERDGVVSFLKKHGNGPAYNEEVTKHIDTTPVGGKNAGSAPGGGDDRDELFAQAGMFVIEKDKASIGLLQRMFRIGFNRAARIMDQLSEAGVVGPEEGTKPRQIIMSKEQFENYLEENG